LQPIFFATTRLALLTFKFLTQEETTIIIFGEKHIRGNHNPKLTEKQRSQAYQRNEDVIKTEMTIPPFAQNYLSKAYRELMVYPSCPQRSDPKSAGKDNK